MHIELSDARFWCDKNRVTKSCAMSSIILSLWLKFKCEVVGGKLLLVESMESTQKAMHRINVKCNRIAYVVWHLFPIFVGCSQYLTACSMNHPCHPNNPYVYDKYSCFFMNLIIFNISRHHHTLVQTQSIWKCDELSKNHLFQGCLYLIWAQSR